jgi:hypothetical protein
MLGAAIYREQGLPDAFAQNERFNPVYYFTVYEKQDSDFIKLAALADSTEELDAVRRQYMRELKNRDTLERAGAMGVVAGIGAQFLDPINLIPVGGVSYRTYRIGENILKGAAVSGSVAMGATAAQEATLHKLQLTRTFGESAINVAGAALLGSVIGGGAAGLSTAARVAGRKLDEIELDIQQGMNPEGKIARGEPSSGTSELIVDRIDTIYSSDLKVAEQIEADSVNAYKRSLERDLKLRLPRGERKRLLDTKRQLQFELDNAARLAPPLPTGPGMGARRAKQLGQRQYEENILNRMSEIDEQLAVSKTGEDAQANLSRLEQQGTVPAEIREKIDMRKAQASRVEEILTSEEYLKIREEVDAETDLTGTALPTKEEEILTRDALGEDSGGAMKVLNSPEVKGKLARGILKMLAWADPVSRLSTSINPESRALLAEMAETSLLYDKMKRTGPGGEIIDEFDFIPNAIETRIKTRSDRLHINALQFANEQLRLYRASNPDNPMSDIEFFEAISNALRRNDEHANGFVQAASKHWRKEVYDPLLADAQKILGPDNRPLLPEDIDTKTALSYLNRKFRADLITEKQTEWNDIVGRWVKGEDVKGKQLEVDQAIELLKGTKEGTSAYKKAKEALQDAEARLLDIPSDAEYRALALEIANRIKAQPGQVLPYDYEIGKESSGKSKTAPVSGPLQKRKFMIPDELIEQFLENDIRKLSQNYTNNMVSQLEFNDTFGSTDLQAEIKKVSSWWDKHIAEQPARKQAKLEKIKAKEIDAIEGIRDRISFRFKATENPDSTFSRMGRGMLNLNYMRLGGGFVTASFSDVGKIVMAEGLFNTLRYGFAPLVKNFKNFRLAAKEAKELGIGIDVLMGSNRAKVLAEIDNYGRGDTLVERALQSGADRFGRINLMDYWTASTKQLHAVVLQNRVISQLKKGRIPKDLKHLGIDDADAKGIMGELARHGESVPGAELANIKDWDNANLANLWAEAMRKESDRVVVMPGQEKPLLMSKQYGQVFFQFKSFMYSATHKILIGGLQGRDAHALQGVISMVAMGALSYYVKETTAGREISDDPRVWIDEGIDRSGLLGVLGEVENSIEKLSGGNVGIRSMIGVDTPSSRYAARSWLSTAVGPTYGSFLNTVAEVTNATTGEEGWQEADTRALRRLLPYQNLFYLRGLIDEGEEGINGLIFD